uniref:C2 domain-containing protein n=1 Tax=Romanomermis culicivorax TaxID=13658 RepID=A0A915J4J8_ROMCU
MQIFSDVEDINANLEIGVFDEDKESHDFLGKIIVPLLEMQSGQSEWFVLKDKNLENKSKGRILLRFDLKWNPIKAAFRTFEPAECKYVRTSVKFQKAIFMRLVDRLKKIIDSIILSVSFTKSCFTWEYPVRSIVAFL